MNIFDHAKAIHDLLKAGVDIYTSIETAEALGVTGHHRINLLTSGFQEKVGEWAVLSFDLAHDVPTHGFLIGAPDGDKCLFIPDTSYIRNRFEGLNIIAIECNYISDILSEKIQHGLPVVVGHRIRHTHMSLETVINFLKANDLSKCREIHLLHLSDGNSDEARMIKKVQETTGIPTYACKN